MAKNTASTAPAKVAKASKKQFDLSTSQVADGALKPLRSVYEIMGVKNVSYREKTYASYQDQLRRMNVIELQDHAYEIGVLAGSTKDSMIDRLERKFLQENPEQRDAHIAARAAANGKTEADGESIADQAARIIARGR